MMGKVNLFFSFFLLFLIAFFSCKKSNEPIIEYNKGAVSAFRNEESWNALCTSKYSSTNEKLLYLYFRRYNMYNELRESIVISKVIPEVGKFHLVNSIENDEKNFGSLYSHFVADGDAIDGIYYVVESDSCYIDIKLINLTTGDFAGKFNITYVKDTSFYINPNLPDTLKFTEGEFQTKIQENW